MNFLAFFSKPFLNIFLKTHRQISKKRCFESYCSCDETCQFSALENVIWKKMAIDSKQINKRVWIFIYQTMSLSSVEKKKILGPNWRLHLCEINCFITFTVFMKLRKIKKLLIRTFNSTWKKKQDFSTSVLGTCENVYLLLSLSQLVSFGVFILI